MEIELSDHANDQIRKRYIPERLVKETVQNPDEILKSFKGRRLLRRQVGDKILEVITVTEETKMVVVTAYYLKEDKL